MVPLQIELPEHFLDQEVRCGYTVTRQMKEVWAIELDLLAKVQGICEKYGIEYFADGGTLLGAIRHNGFIPWDDDIDLMMDRSNFKRFAAIAKKEFSYPYYFQGLYSFEYLRGHAKIIRKDTCAILKSELNRRFSFPQGIFIDIFIYDNVPDSESLFTRYINKCIQLKKKAYKMRNIFHSDEGESRILKKICSSVMRVLHLPNFIYYRFEHYCQKYNKFNTRKFANISFMPDRKKGFVNRASYAESLPVDFEFMKINCPAVYTDFLEEYYGEGWREYVMGTSNHGELILDVDNSYKEYLRGGRFNG